MWQECKGHICYCLLFMVVALFSFALVAEEVYHWPLDLPRDLSSSFGEYRTGRFHAGIDLRTGGVTGKTVYAAADGYVSRVRCSPWGYGKAVYVQFKDGNSVVYGHLDDYTDSLREYVRKNQHTSKSYTVDLYPEAGQFPVQRGQQIAVSGSTGVGPPHLHYELRDSAGRPFNPRLAGVDWPDTTRPTFRGLLIAPDGAGGTVNGGFKPITLEVMRQEKGCFTTAPITASGRIGIGVDVIDPGNDGIKMGVHLLRLVHGDREIFQVLHDRIAYDNIHNGAVAYHPFFLDKGHFLLLWRWPGNVSSLYANSPGSGWFDVPDTPTELVVEAVDFLGNKAELIIPIQPEPQVTVSTAVANSGTVLMECNGECLTLTATFSVAEGTAPELLVENGDDIKSAVFRQVTDRAWMAAFKPERGGAYTLRVHHPRISSFEETVYVFLRGGSERTITAGDVGVTIKSDSPYGLMFLQMSPITVSLKSSIPQLGDAWRLWPEETPVDAQVDLTLPVNGSAKGRIYRNAGSGWRYVGGKRQGNSLTASIRSFGVYAVLEDTKSPTIGDISPPIEYRAQTKRPIVRAVISDVGSGIDDYTVTANGQWLLASYDPDTNRLEWERDEDLASGEQELVFSVTDSVGNNTTVRRTVFIP